MAIWRIHQITHLARVFTGTNLREVLFSFKKTYTKESSLIKEMDFEVILPVSFKIINFKLFDYIGMHSSLKWLRVKHFPFEKEKGREDEVN